MTLIGLCGRRIDGRRGLGRFLFGLRLVCVYRRFVVQPRRARLIRFEFFGVRFRVSIGLDIGRCRGLRTIIDHGPILDDRDRLGSIILDDCRIRARRPRIDGRRRRWRISLRRPPDKTTRTEHRRARLGQPFDIDATGPGPRCGRLICSGPRGVIRDGLVGGGHGGVSDRRRIRERPA